MPHFIVEYSSNLEASVDFGALAKSIRDTAVSTGVFPLGGIRVRMYRSEVYEIADGLESAGFVHIMLRMGAGRDLATRKKAGTAVFDQLQLFFADHLENTPFALSFEIIEIDPDLNFKKNSIRNYLSST